MGKRMEQPLPPVDNVCVCMRLWPNDQTYFNIHGRQCRLLKLSGTFRTYREMGL